MIRVLREDRVGLGAGERLVARDRGDATHVVALVEVERAEHLVGGDRHRREELHAVGAAALVLAHHAVVETHGALRRVRDC